MAAKFKKTRLNKTFDMGAEPKVCVTILSQNLSTDTLKMKWGEGVVVSGDGPRGSLLLPVPVVCPSTLLSMQVVRKLQSSRGQAH